MYRLLGTVFVAIFAGASPAPAMEFELSGDIGAEARFFFQDPRLAEQSDAIASGSVSFKPEFYAVSADESESLLFGRNFGVGTDIQTGPDGNLYVVSLSHGTVYEIHRRDRGGRDRND